MQNRVILRVEKSRVLLKQCPLVFVPHCTRCPLQSISHLFTRKLPSFTPIQMRISAAPFGKFGQFQASSAQNLVPQRSSKNGLNSLLETSWHSLLVNLMKRPAHFLLTCYSPKSTPPLWLLPPFPSPANVRISWDAPPDPLQTFPQSNLQLC